MKRAGMLGAVVAAGVLAMASFALAGASLDGKTFSGKIGEQGKTESQADNFVFQDGKFESTLCTTFGYGKGAYETKAAGDALQFTAQTASKDGGTMRWKGSVKGDQIEGTVATTEKGKTSESWFKGELKKS